MKQLLMSLACTAMLMGNAVFAQQNDKDKTKDRQQQGQKGQQQTIRGTIAGVTAMGEMAIDPQSREAVVVEADYLAVLGTPSQGASFQGDQNQQNKAGQKNNKKQNLYFVALTPQTKVHWAKGQSEKSETNSSKAQGQNKNQSALEDLEIGDRVEIQFSNEQQLQAKSEDSKTGQKRTAGFRGDKNSKKHGRDRIFVGKASEISILSGPKNQSEQNQKQNNKDKNET